MVDPEGTSRRMQRFYTHRLRDRGIQGIVVLVLVIGKDGRVELGSERIVSASHPALIEPTMKGLALMRFALARLDGRPVRVRATLAITWALRDR